MRPVRFVSTAVFKRRGCESAEVDIRRVNFKILRDTPSCPAVKIQTFRNTTMKTTPAELLARLHYSEPSRFPKAAMKEIIDRKDEMIPHLIAVLEFAHANPAEYIDGPQCMLPTYAAYLLAQFRETSAYRPLLALLNLEGNLAEQLFGDSITEDMHNILACIFDGDETPLRTLIENPLAGEFARASAGLQTYPALIHASHITRVEVERYFHDLLDHKLEREPAQIWNNLCSISADLGFAAMLPLIHKAFDDDLCDPLFDHLEHMEQRITSGGNSRWMRDCEPIDDVVATMETWACFHRSSSPRPSAVNSEFFKSLSKTQEFSSRPSVLPPPKYPGVGRNDLCPCGSGRKFKKCCG